MKFDPIFVEPYANPLLCKQARSEYWSPEFETHRIKYWPNTLRTAANVDLDDQTRPMYQEYRKGLNTNGEVSNLGTPAVNAFGFVEAGVANSYTANSDEFVESYLGGSYLQYTNQWRLTRLSPVARHGARPPLR